MADANTQEVKDIDQKLKLFHKELEKIDDKLENNLRNLDTNYDNVLQKIVSVRKEINSYLDRAEKKVRDEVARMQEQDEKELKTLHTETKTMKAEIEVMLKTLHDSCTNMSSLFVTTKEVEQRLVAMETGMNKIKQSQHQPCKFYISDEIKRLVLAEIPLGKLSQDPEQRPHVQVTDLSWMEPLTASMLAAVSPDKQKQMFGERFYPIIEGMYPNLAAKITGMFLEMDTGELLHLLDSMEALRAKVEEAVSVLQASI